MPNYHQIHTNKLHKRQTSHQAQIGPEAAAFMCDACLDAATEEALASVNEQNRRRRNQLRDDLSSHLASLPYGRTLDNCAPEDLLVYLQMIYIPRHANSLLPNGACIAAPSTIANVVSHLRMLFKELGRGEQWVDHSTVGNPAALHQISQ